MNIELLEKVKAHILAEPKRLFMPGFLARRSSKDEEGAERYPECGTIGCYAGWICELSGIRVGDGKEVAEKASELADLDFIQSTKLFYSHVPEWSEEDNAKLWSGDGTPETAALAARRIDLFIASEGVK